ncbi:MAG: endonuclease/exonuclease/phosphatase family protein [Chloroflexota bacterium]
MHESWHLPTTTLGWFGSLLRGVFLYGTNLYILTGLVYLVFRFTTGESSVVVTLGNILLHWFLMLSLGLLVVALLMRAWWHSGVLLGFVAAFMLLYGGLFLPGSPASAAPPVNANLRLLTYNTANRYTHPEELTALLRRVDADVVGLVELSAASADEINIHLRDLYPYRIVRGEGVPGKALLSKYPLVGWDVFTLQTERPNIQATINVNGQQVDVLVAHPPSPDMSRSLNFYATDPNNLIEVQALLERVDMNRPTVMLGDYNFTDQSAAHHLVRQAGFVDAYQQVGRGFGGTVYGRSVRINRQLRWYAWRDPAIARIDYVFFSAPHFRAVSAITEEPIRSDHKPVVAELQLWR